LKQGIDVLIEKSSFAKGESLLGIHFPKFDWLLWHYSDFVSRKIHHGDRFFRVTLGEGQIS
jgi:hypothetical protein